MNLVEVDYSAGGGDDPLESAGDSSAESTSKLDKRIQDLMKIFFDVKGQHAHGGAAAAPLAVERKSCLADFFSARFFLSSSVSDQEDAC